MIAYLKGKLAHKDRTHVIIDVQGVGYEVKISLQTYDALKDGNESIQLFTHLQIKEDSHTLVGFIPWMRNICFWIWFLFQGWA